MNDRDIANKVKAAVRHFWQTRSRQKQKQGLATGQKDAGNRRAVTGGAQLDGFIRVVSELLQSVGIAKTAISCNARNSTYLPGFFRPTKSWDLVVTVGGCLLACIEFKSQVGSFGNNFNNRTEESVGSAHDFWTAYREGAFAGSPRPWLGYLMLLEDAPGSTRPIKVNEPHFVVFPEFRDASYARRYELLCTKFLRERLYDAACLILSDRASGKRGGYSEPNVEIGFVRFARSLLAHAMAYADQ